MWQSVPIAAATIRWAVGPLYFQQGAVNFEGTM